MARNNGNGYMATASITVKQADGKFTFVDEFKGIHDLYFLVKCKVLLTDVAGRICSVKKERDRILAQFRTFAEGYPGQIKSYIEYQRKIALPLYRSIIKMCLDIADKNMKVQYNNDRYEIIKALMEALDLVITEMDIIDPTVNSKND